MILIYDDKNYLLKNKLKMTGNILYACDFPQFHTHVTKDLRLVGGFIYINLRVVVGVVP